MKRSLMRWHADDEHICFAVVFYCNITEYVMLYSKNAIHEQGVFAVIHAFWV